MQNSFALENEKIIIFLLSFNHQRKLSILCFSWYSSPRSTSLCQLGETFALKITAKTNKKKHLRRLQLPKRVSRECNTWSQSACWEDNTGHFFLQTQFPEMQTIACYDTRKKHTSVQRKPNWFQSFYDLPLLHQSIQLPTLHSTVIEQTVVGLTRERFVAHGLPSWTHLRIRYWSVVALQGLKRIAACAWPMVLRKLGNRWKCKGESWFHCTKVLCVGVVGIAEMWFYSVLSEKQQPVEKIVENCWAMRSWKPRRIVTAVFKWLLIEFELLLQGRKWELVFTLESHFVDFSHDH